MALTDRKPTTEEVIVDAAEDCFATLGVRRTTIEEIAAAAGVSRITVYRRVGGRDDIVLAVLVRTTERFLARLRPRLMAQRTLEGALVVLVRSTALAARRNDLSLLFASEERGATGAPLPGAMAPLAAMFGAEIGLAAERLPGRLADGFDLIDAGEWLLRVIVSLATTEPSRPRTQSEIDRWVRQLALSGLLADEDGT
jgi:AcrR family transcriptional regulator